MSISIQDAFLMFYYLLWLFSIIKNNFVTIYSLTLNLNVQHRTRQKSEEFIAIVHTGIL